MVVSFSFARALFSTFHDVPCSTTFSFSLSSSSLDAHTYLRERARERDRERGKERERGQRERARACERERDREREGGNGRGRWGGDLLAAYEHLRYQHPHSAFSAGLPDIFKSEHPGKCDREKAFCADC